MFHEEEYHGYRIRIEPEEYPESPREWDNLGTMICKHRDYDLGDVKESKRYEKCYGSIENDMAHYFYYEHYKSYRSPQYIDDYDELTEKGVQAILNKVEKDFVVLPLYLYDHSGITMNTTGFSCRWDSGQVGFIYVSKAKITSAKNWRQSAQENLVAEVKIYDNYLTGNVGVMIIEKDDEIVESCSGYYPDDSDWDEMIDEARAIVDHLEEI